MVEPTSAGVRLTTLPLVSDQIRGETTIISVHKKSKDVKVGLEMGGKAQERLEEPVEIRRISKVRSSLCKNEKL